MLGLAVFVSLSAARGGISRTTCVGGDRMVAARSDWLKEKDAVLFPGL